MLVRAENSLGFGEPDRVIALALQLPLLAKDVHTLGRLI